MTNQPQIEQLTIEAIELQAALHQAVRLLMGWQRVASQAGITGHLTTATGQLFASNAAVAQALVDVHAEEDKWRAGQ